MDFHITNLLSSLRELGCEEVIINKARSIFNDLGGFVGVKLPFTDPGEALALSNKTMPLFPGVVLRYNDTGIYKQGDLLHPDLPHLPEACAWEAINFVSGSGKLSSPNSQTVLPQKRQASVQGTITDTLSKKTASQGAVARPSSTIKQRGHKSTLSGRSSSSSGERASATKGNNLSSPPSAIATKPISPPAAALAPAAGSALPDTRKKPRAGTRKPGPSKEVASNIVVDAGVEIPKATSDSSRVSSGTRSSKSTAKSKGDGNFLSSQSTIQGGGDGLFSVFGIGQPPALHKHGSSLPPVPLMWPESLESVTDLPAKILSTVVECMADELDSNF